MPIRAIDYGKRHIPVYRFGARPLEGVTPVPESPFRGRANRLFGADVDVRVLGDNFVPAYTEGDNRNVVATDSMKNFVLSEALAWEGATLEHLVHHLAEAFLTSYPHMQRLVVGGTEIPFDEASVPDGGGGFAPSEVLLARAHGDRDAVEVELERAPEGGVRVIDHRCARLGMQLVKTTGSSFASFVRDEHTTLPEVHDRPLYIHLDVRWRYDEPADAFGGDPARLVPGRQVRDVCAAVFESFVSMSIQHLVHAMGERLLARFPQLAEVSFAAQNRLWDPAATDAEEPARAVRTDPRPPYGDIGLVMTRERLERAGTGAEVERERAWGD